MLFVASGASTYTRATHESCANSIISKDDAMLVNVATMIARLMMMMMMMMMARLMLTTTTITQASVARTAVILSKSHTFSTVMMTATALGNGARM